jgi:hypothetical protein
MKKAGMSVSRARDRLGGNVLRNQRTHCELEKSQKQLGKRGIITVRRVSAIETHASETKETSETEAISLQMRVNKRVHSQTTDGPYLVLVIAFERYSFSIIILDDHFF